MIFHICVCDKGTERVVLRFADRLFFKIGEDGAALYFPWGIFGAGYIVDSPARKNRY